MKIAAPILAASLLTLSACASIIEGSSDKVFINTVGTKSASCRVNNERFSSTANSMSSVDVMRSKTDLNVDCSDQQTGSSGKTTVASDLEPWTFGNILLGGIIGLGVDLGTGSAWNYPAQIDVNMQQSQPAPAALTPVPAVNGAVAPQAAPVQSQQKPTGFLVAPASTTAR